MKRFVYVVAMLLLAACNDSGMEERRLASNEYEFYAYVSDVASEARTYADAQQKLHWTNDDRITIFHGMLQPLQFAFMGATGAQSGTYRNVDAIFYAPDPNAPDNVAIYPYSANHQLDEQTRAVALTMPAEQTYAENSFGLNANTMIAITSDVNDLALYFKNVGTFLDVRLWGENQTVKSITITATGGEPLSGNATVTPVYNGNPTCVMSNTNVSPSVKLKCEEPVTVNTTEDAPVSFWLVLPPGPMAQGFTATVENAEGETQTFEVARSVTFQRNKHNKLTRELAIKEKTPIAPEGLVTIHNEEKGMLLVALMDYAYDEIVSMKVTGTMNDEDFLWVYYEMPALRYLDISEVNITTLPNRSFYQSKNVETIIMPQTLQTIPSEVFYESAVKEVYLNEGLQTIGESAFENCDNLMSIHIPHSVETIGAKAFYDCNKLETLTFAGGCKLTSLGGNIFSSTPIKSVQIPANVETIATESDSPFYNCQSLRTVTFEENAKLETLGKSFGASESTDIKSIEVPNSVTTIAKGAFENTTTLINVFFETGANLGVIGQNAFLNTSISKITIPASVTNICMGAFARCSSLTDVLFENNSQLENISTDYPSTIEDVYIHDYIDTNYVGTFAFSSVQQIEIPNSVKVIGPRAFYHCDKLQSLTFQENSQLQSIKGGTIEVYGYYYNTGGTYYRYYGNGAFELCTSLTNITIPRSVQEIGVAAFRKSGIETLKFEDMSQLSIIDGFDGKSNLDEGYLGTFANTLISELIIPTSVTKIGDCVFRGCENLQKLTFEDNSKIKTIGVSAFRTCSKLNKINFGSNTAIQAIDSYAFSGCNLTALNIPASLELIGFESFSSNSNLVMINFAVGSLLSNIDGSAFRNCGAIHYFYAQNVTRLKRVGSYAFAGCDDMRLFKLGTIECPEAYDNSFGDIGTYSVLKVPTESVNAYKAATGWRNFASITGLDE